MHYFRRCTIPRHRCGLRRLWSFARVGWLSDADAGPVKAMVEHDPEIKVRIAGVNALAKGWPEDPLLYPFLLGRLKVVTDQEERSTIGWALGSLAPPSNENLPALLDALSTDNRVLRESIAVALGKLGHARPGPPCRTWRESRELKSRTRTVHFPPCQAIVTIDPKGPEAQALIEPVTILLRDEGPGFQQQQAVNILVEFWSIGRVGQCDSGGAQEQEPRCQTTCGKRPGTSRSRGDLRHPGAHRAGP